MWWKLLVGLLVLILVAGITLQVAYWRFDRAANRRVQSAWQARVGIPSAPLPEVAALPEPVRRYLRFARVADRAPMRQIRLEHGGLFRMAPGGSWLPMQAVEHFFTGPPGFVWNARVRMAPGVTVAVRDAYLEGRGSVHARLLALIPVATAAGAEVDQSALLRWLAEAPWFPTALRGGPYLEWVAMDGSHARAVVRDGDVTASAVFTFAQDGRITALESDDRYRSTEDGQVRTPWRARYSDYREFGGVLAPAVGEVAWDLPAGEYVYARVEVEHITFDPP